VSLYVFLAAGFLASGLVLGAVSWLVGVAAGVPVLPSWVAVLAAHGRVRRPAPPDLGESP
jgi:hypothetical protein